MVSAMNMFIRRAHCTRSQKANRQDFIDRLMKEHASLREAQHPLLHGKMSANQNAGIISKSLYDRVLYIHRHADLHVIFFDDLVSCSTTLLENLRAIFNGFVDEKFADCVINQCKAGVQRNVANKGCSNVARQDIPDSIVSYIVSHNKWYYCIAQRQKLAELKKEREHLDLSCQ